jgi:hypothetical protein
LSQWWTPPHYYYYYYYCCCCCCFLAAGAAHKNKELNWIIINNDSIEICTECMRFFLAVHISHRFPVTCLKLLIALMDPCCIFTSELLYYCWFLSKWWVPVTNSTLNSNPGAIW